MCLWAWYGASENIRFGNIKHSPPPGNGAFRACWQVIYSSLSSMRIYLKHDLMTFKNSIKRYQTDGPVLGHVLVKIINNFFIVRISKKSSEEKDSEYVLKWGSHNNQLLQLFSDLLSSNTFTDVILEAKSKTFHAHQLVLSACSPFFRSLFITSQVSHQTVICKVRS